MDSDSALPKLDVVQLTTGEKRSSDVVSELQMKPSSEANSNSALPEKKLKIDECESSFPDHDEEESSSVDVGPCYFSLLPNEILQMIFSHISSQHEQIRQVCKLWYEVSNSRQKPDEWFIRDVREIWKSSASFEHIENCGFKYLNLCFKARDMEIFPVTMWEKIGTRIRSLEFRGCTLGDQIMERIILFCPNLQVLRIILRFGLNIDPNVSLCSIEMLKKLNVARNTLGTFEIGVMRGLKRLGSNFPMIRNVKCETWNEIFRGLFHVFPNVVHFSWTKIYKKKDEFEEVFKCAFMRDRASTSDNEAIASVMAHSLSASTWTAAFSELAKVRLASISLSASDSLSSYDGNEDSLTNFFQNPRKLKSIKINLPVPESISYHISTTLILEILKNCDELVKLECFENIFWLGHLTLDEENEMSRLLKLSPKLEKVVLMSMFALDLKSRSLSYIPSRRQKLPWYHLPSRSNIFFFKHFPDLQHLTLDPGMATDCILQNIFQFFINLRTLRLTLDHNNTNFGITGRKHGHLTGYGIVRLQNLEKLSIQQWSFLTSSVDENIFEDFCLPNLKHLRCVFFQESSTFSLIGTLMPLLEDIVFLRPSSRSIPMEESLLHLCRWSHNLKVLQFDFFAISVEGAKQMVMLCPTLKLICSKDATYYYNDLTRKCQWNGIESNGIIITE